MFNIFYLVRLGSRREEEEARADPAGRILIPEVVVGRRVAPAVGRTGRNRACRRRSRTCRRGRTCGVWPRGDREGRTFRDRSSASCDALLIACFETKPVKYYEFTFKKVRTTRTPKHIFS